MKKRILFSLVVALMFIAGCERPATTAGKGISEENGAAKNAQIEKGTEAPAASISVGNVVLTPREGEAVTFAVEVADTPDVRRQGLQGRENLGEKQGMWFVFESDTRDAFWMKDTLMPLDMIFVGADGRIVDILSDTRPNSESLLIPNADYRYVLEVKAGTAAKLNLKAGDKAEFRLGPR